MVEQNQTEVSYQTIDQAPQISLEMLCRISLYVEGNEGLRFVNTMTTAEENE